jgi:hypothetical protein
VKVIDTDVGVAEFVSITKDDLTAKGRIRPMGARHFAERARTVQELTSFIGSAIGQDQAVKAHLSGFRVAQIIEELLGLQKYELVKKNIGVLEQFETQQVANAAQQQLSVEGAMPVEEAPGELGAEPMVVPPTQGAA